MDLLDSGPHVRPFESWNGLLGDKPRKEDNEMSLRLFRKRLRGTFVPPLCRGDQDSIINVGYPTGGIRMANATLVYDAKMDSKKRLTLRGAKYEYYNVQEMDDGSVILSPRILISPFEVSQNTLDTMDESMENFKAGKVSKPIKL